MITINTMAQILGVTELTIRRMIKDEKLEAKKLDNGTYFIEHHEALKYVHNNPKYSHTKLNLLEYIAKEEGIVQKEEKEDSDDIEILNTKVTKNSVRVGGIQIIEAFNEHLKEAKDITILPEIIRQIEHKLDVTKQPNMEGIVNILNKVVSVKSHCEIKVGEVLSGDKIAEIFGRKPQQEGINFCMSTKELFIITKLGVNNPAVQSAEYNDYWKLGKIYYEGKGQDIQEFKGSNLHLFRKLQVYKKQIKCKEGVPEYIHVFNKISNKEINKFQYLGIFDVTDFAINEHSSSISKDDNKTAIVFELTPRVDKTSDSIDENYIF